MIKKFEQFNESVRDMMKPKSTEDIIKKLDTSPKGISSMLDRVSIEEQDQFYSSLMKFTPMDKVNEIFLDYICKNKENLTRNSGKNTLNKINNILVDLLPYVETDNVLEELSMMMYEEMNDEQAKNAINMFVQFQMANESVRDMMKSKPTTEVNSVLDEYIKKIETTLKADPYDYDAFTATNFVDFISNYYGCADMDEIVVKLIELEYMNPENMLSEWIDGIDSVSSYSEDDSKEQLKNFLETIKELKK